MNQGYFMVRSPVTKGNQTFSIPLALQTLPMINRAILWVLVGIFMALGFWEVFKYLDKRLTQTGAENEIRGARIEVPRKITAATDILGIENFLKSVGHVQSVATKMAKAEALESRYATPQSTAKIGILQIGSVALGIAVAYIGLLNNDYVANIRAIGFQDAIVLIGLGLGIGSLKEIFDK